MTTFPIPQSAGRTALDDAATAVLYAFDLEGGRRPGDFTASLIDAWQRADYANKAALGVAFPELGWAIRTITESPDGAEELRSVLRPLPVGDPDAMISFDDLPRIDRTDVIAAALTTDHVLVRQIGEGPALDRVTHVAAQRSGGIFVRTSSYPEGFVYCTTTESVQTLWAIDPALAHEMGDPEWLAPFTSRWQAAPRRAESATHGAEIAVKAIDAKDVKHTDVVVEYTNTGVSTDSVWRFGAVEYVGHRTNGNVKIVTGLCPAGKELGPKTSVAVLVSISEAASTELGSLDWLAPFAVSGS